MSRRIDIELTSARPDGTWTWRAAGARQPKGTLDGTLIPTGVKAGEVLRAEADFEIEGITIVSVLPPKERHRAEPEHLELIARPEPEVGVTTQLVTRTDRRGGERRRDGDDRPPRRDGPRGGDSRGGSDRGASRNGAAPSSDGGGRGGPGGPRRDPAGRDGRPSSGGARPSERPTGDRSRQGAGGPARPDRPRRDRPEGTGTDQARRDRPERSAGGETPRPRAGAEAAGRTRTRRLNPANTHRAAAMAALPPEEIPIAEQVLRGGIPAVRTALHLERERATAEGRAAPNVDALLAMAESILPKLKAADWRDRAEAAAKAPADITLRDLRSVVIGADAARDEESRALAATLRDALDQRVNALRTDWTNEITHHLDEGRVVRALRLSGRPPEPSTKLPDELTTRLTETASAAMAPDAPADRWVALLEAVAASPVRRAVHPVGLPAEPGAELLRAAHQQSARIPALVAMLGISIPPPPPRRPAPPAGARTATGPRRGPSASSSKEPEHNPSPAEAPAAEADASVAEAPVAEAPAAEAPAAEAPAAEAPAAGAPVAEASVAEAPDDSAEAPMADIEAAGAPSEDVPAN